MQARKNDLVYVRICLNRKQVQAKLAQVGRFSSQHTTWLKEMTATANSSGGSSGMCVRCILHCMTVGLIWFIADVCV